MYLSEPESRHIKHLLYCFVSQSACPLKTYIFSQLANSPISQFSHCQIEGLPFNVYCSCSVFVLLNFIKVISGIKCISDHHLTCFGYSVSPVWPLGFWCQWAVSCDILVSLLDWLWKPPGSRRGQKPLRATVKFSLPFVRESLLYNYCIC